MPDLFFLGEVAMRSSLILGVVWVLLSVMKRASASERHLVMGLGLLVVAFVPVGMLLSPRLSWTISLPRPPETGGVTQKMTAFFLENDLNFRQTPLASWPKNKPSMQEVLTISNGLVALIMGGMLVQGMVLGRAASSWQKIRRQAVKTLLPEEAVKRVKLFAGAKKVPPIFVSDQVTIPSLVGWLRPAIILPSEADQWSSERLVMVLCHEIAHFRRGDYGLLPMICVLRVFYWWHPLIWMALARLRRERENACDDLVLNENVRATDYAELIVATARQAETLGWGSGALAMASPSHLGERIRAILNPDLNRRQASRTTVFIGLTLAFALGWFFAATHVHAEGQPITLGSINKDASKPQIELEFKLFKIDQKTYSEQQEKIDTALDKQDISFLKNLGGISLLSAPKVTLLSGLKAEVDVTRDFRYATKFDMDKDGKMVPSDYKTRKLGVQIEALPILLADRQSIDLRFTCEVASLEGWIGDPSSTRQPIFKVRRISTQRLVFDHAYFWVGEDPKDRSSRTVALIVVARQVDAN
jgi:beta-lactamase regulating signal transducer with metallopeptidase domain